MTEWGTVFVVAVFGGLVFGSVFLAELVGHLLARLRRPHGPTKEEDLPATSSAPRASRRRHLQEGQAPHAPQALTDRPVVRVRLAPRKGRNAAAR